MVDYYRANECAIDLRNKHDLNEIPTNVIKILDGENISLEGIEDGSDGYLDRAQKTIYVKSSHTTQRKIFTIAHEIGHYFLHNSPTHDRNTDDKSHNYSDEEREANAFAAELLMPKSKVLGFMKRGFDCEEIAEMFFVSKEFAYNRIENLRYFL